MAKRSPRESRPARVNASGTRPSPAQTAANPRRWFFIQVVLIIAAGFAVFWPSAHGGWIGDDSLYITNNRLLLDPQRLWKAWFEIGSFVEYYPIQETLQWVEWKLWGNDTFGYHLTNIILHLGSAFLIWRLLSRLGIRSGWLGALLFVVHPMTVDSVALINEFKTSLSFPPFLLAMITWVNYENSKSPRLYFGALALFVVAMLCKITMMMFPFVIPLYAWWKRGKISVMDLVASLPFLAVSVALGFASLRAGQIYEPPDSLALPDPLTGHLLVRFVLAGQTLLFYFSRIFLPVVPIPTYPLWSINPTWPANFLPWLVIIGALAWLWFKRQTWGRHAILGLGYFAIMLAPFCGLHWISYMNFTWVLEHLLYIPILGLIGLVVAAYDHICSQLPVAKKKIAVAIALLLLALMAGQSHFYAAQFVNQETLCRYMIQRNPSDAQVYINLGLTLLQQERYYEAIAAYRAGLEIHPDNPDLLNSLGNVLEITGNETEAIEQLRKALKIEPNRAAFHANLGNALSACNQFPEAIEHYRETVQIEPKGYAGYYDLGVCLAKESKTEDALIEFQHALQLDPHYNPAHFALGQSLLQLGRKPEAIQQFQIILADDPGNHDARVMLNYAQGSN